MIPFIPIAEALTVRALPAAIRAARASGAMLGRAAKASKGALNGALSSGVARAQAAGNRVRAAYDMAKANPAAAKDVAKAYMQHLGVQGVAAGREALSAARGATQTASLLARTYPKTTAALAAIPVVGSVLDGALPQPQGSAATMPIIDATNAVTHPTVTPQMILGHGPLDPLAAHLNQAIQSQAYQALADAQGVLQRYNPALHLGEQAQALALLRMRQLFDNIDAAKVHGQMYLFAPDTLSALGNIALRPYTQALAALPAAATAVANAATQPDRLATDRLNARAALLGAEGSYANNYAAGLLNLARAQAQPALSASEQELNMANALLAQQRAAHYGDIVKAQQMQALGAAMAPAMDVLQSPYTPAYLQALAIQSGNPVLLQLAAQQAAQNQ